MITYKPDKSYTNPLRNVIIWVTAVFLIAFAIDLIFKTNLIQPNYYFVIGGLLAIRLFDHLSTNRVKEISFDPEKKVIHLASKNIFSSQENKTLAFEEVQLEIFTVRSRSLKGKRMVAVYFMKNKKEAGEISESKDGFSAELLATIWQQAEQFSIPVTKI